MKFDMSEAWREASAMISANREVLVVVAGIFFLLPNLLLTLNMPDLSSLAMEDPRAVEGAVLEFYGRLWWVMLIAVVASIVGYLALLALLRDATRPTVSQALGTGLAGLLPAIGVYVLFVGGASLAFGLLLGIAVASGVSALQALVIAIAFAGIVYLSIKVSMAAPVIAIEKIRNPVKVLARSWRLTKGNSLRLFLFFLLIFIVYMVISVLAGVALGALSLAFGEEAFKVVNAIVTGLLATAVAVVAVAVLAAIHRQLAGESPEQLGQTFE